MNKYFHSVAAATALFGGTLLMAQEPPRREPGSPLPPNSQEPHDRTNPSSVTGKVAADQQSDSILVTWLLVDNENEIALARIAQQRATNPEVKQFAQKMIDDHTQIVQK